MQKIYSAWSTGIENLRKQMLEEAMAQLTANQEKIAASEGKGPTWEDKVRKSS